MKVIVTLKGQQRCYICDKGSGASYNRPKSLHKTKRVIYHNLQKNQGRMICTACLRQFRKDQ